MVVDYAGSKTADLKRLLERCAELAQENLGGGLGRVRVVLLERTAARDGGWLRELLGTGEGRLREDLRDAMDEPLPLGTPVGDDADETMRQILASALEGLARYSQARGKETALLQLPDFTANDFAMLRHHTDGRPLFLMMAAMRAWEIGDAGGIAAWSRQHLVDYAIEREEDYIAKRVPDERERRLVEHLAAILHFTGPRERDDPSLAGWLREAADALSYGRDLVGAALDRGQEVFAESERSPMQPILPDLLGAAFAARMLQRNRGMETLRGILAACDPASAERLLRSVHDLYGLTEQKDLLEWLSTLIETMDGGQLRMMSYLMPEKTISLRACAARVEERILDGMSAEDQGSEEGAWLWSRLGFRHNALGHREEALAATQRAVEIYDRLARTRPEAFEPDLAMSLGALGSAYLVVGSEQHEQAMKAFGRGIRALTPQFIKYPQPSGDLMALLVREYLQSCRDAKREPDQEVLAPVLEIFRTQTILKEGG